MKHIKYTYDQSIITDEEYQNYSNKPVAVMIAQNGTVEKWAGRLRLDERHERTELIVEELMPILVFDKKYDYKELLKGKWDEHSETILQFDKSWLNVVVRTLKHEEYITYKKYILNKKFIY